MTFRVRSDLVVVGTAALYLVALGWAMSTLRYDVWGAMIIAPLLVLVTLPILRRVFSGDLQVLLPLAVVGLVAKFAGCAARYWIAFDAYGGAVDAGRYHSVAAAAAADIHSGAASVTTAIPSGVGAVFIERLTTLIYTIFGTSRFAGFLVFGWMGYCGAVLFVRAAITAVPGLAVRRYAALVFLAPSVVYWPASIGKEAWLVLCLGLAAYGFALLFVRCQVVWALILAVSGVTGVGFARPHIAALWVGALFVTLLTGLVVGRRSSTSRYSTGLLVVLAAVGLYFVATATLRYLNPVENHSSPAIGDRIVSIFDETERRTTSGDSSFKPVDIHGPQDWPEAILRTLTRPLPNEASQSLEILPAIEMTVLLSWLALDRRRLANLLRVMAGAPYVVFAIAVLVMFGLAFTRIGNLGILTRQRSLVMPFLLLLLCTPVRARSTVPHAFQSAIRDVESTGGARG